MNRPHSITASVEIPEDGAEGVLLCQGSAAGGYSLYMKDGKLHYVHNWVGRALYSRGIGGRSAEPASTSCASSSSPRASPTCRMARARPGVMQLYVDGALVANAEAPTTTPFMLNPGALTCGANPGSPVTPDYPSPFKFTGTLQRGDRGRERRADPRPRGRAAYAHGAAVVQAASESSPA